MNSFLSVSSIIFPLITFPYVSRILLPVGTGKVSFATSIITYFAMFAQMGIPTYGIRACAKVRDNKEKLSRTVQEILIINLILSFIVYILFFVALFTIPKLNEDKTLFIVMSFTIIFNTIGVEWLYKALEQYTYITIRSLIFKIIALIAMFILVKVQSDYIIYGGITIFASVGSNIYNIFNVKKLIIIRPVGQYNFKQHIKPILVFFAMSVAVTVYTNMDNVMLGFMKTDEDVGYYNAAVKIKIVLASIISSLGTVLLPRVSYYIEKGNVEEFGRIAKKSINFVMVLAFPLMIYFMIFARNVILLLSGKEYLNSVVPMQIIMPTILFIGLTNIMGIQMLVSLGKEIQVLWSEVYGAAVNFILNLFLIPPMASSGTAISTLIAEIVVFIIQFIYLKDIVIPIFKSFQSKKIILALFCSTILTVWLLLINISNFVILMISSILFFGIYVVVLSILKETITIEVVKHVLARCKINSKHNKGGEA